MAPRRNNRPNVSVIYTTKGEGSSDSHNFAMYMGALLYLSG